MALLFSVFVYTDHEALWTLLTGPDNDAHGWIAKWQERLGEYDLRLLHRPAKTHFMAIADGLSRLPTWLLTSHIAEDTEGCRPLVGILVPVSRQVTDTTVSGAVAMRLRCDGRFWKQLRLDGREELGGYMGLKEDESGRIVRFVEPVMVQREDGDEGRKESGGLIKAARDMKWRRWRKWLESGMYGAIVQVRLEELEGGRVSEKKLEIGQSQRRAFKKALRR